jgi:D-3-phosphoglycerate dehydrogenase
MDVELLDAPELLARADVVSNHMNLNETNRGFFNRETFALMRRKPLLINVGRGETVIEADLARALDEGVVSGAGLDVLAQEEPELEGHPLRGRPNVILTPHMAFYSDTALFDCLRIACQNLTYYLNGEHDKVNRFVPRE